MVNLVLNGEEIKRYSFCEIDGGFEINEEQFELYQANPSHFKIIDGVFTDISQTEEFKTNLFNKQKEEFYKKFIKTSLGCIRLETKIGDFIGILPNYASYAQMFGKLDANKILFYPEPDSSIERDEETLQQWLTENSYYNNEMTLSEFQDFYTEVTDEYFNLFTS